MPKQKSKSSCVSGFAYDKAKSKLTVFYTNRTIYDYENVPISVYTGLLCAESKGKYLNMNVKGSYSYTKR